MALSQGKMGTLRITKHTCEYDIQESYDFIYEYTYCDQCGSFDIGGSSILPRKVDMIIGFIILAGFLAAIVITVKSGSVWYLGCLGGLVELIAYFGFKIYSTRLKCNKCGNKRITSGNVRGYRENDASVIDVPENRVLRKHIETIIV